MFSRIFCPFLLLLVLSAPLQAAVDLVTLPTREATQLTIYNSEDITMVREHRLLTVKEGVNRIQFSWANTLIDPTSIEFRILDQQDKVDLSIPPFRRAATTPCNGTSRARLPARSPSRSGILRRDYLGRRLRGHRQRGRNEDQPDGLRASENNSGEQYDNAQTRLVVGKINLVEKIADLARRPPPRKLPRWLNPKTGRKCKRSWLSGPQGSGQGTSIMLFTRRGWRS